MGKKKKFDGHETGYDYLRNKFDKQYRSHMSDRESSDVYNRKKEKDFQRYLYTGKKTSGSWSMDFARKNRDKDKKKDKADLLFEAGIPVQQWDYYKDKAGNNANSKGDIKDIIAAYNADERYQGPDYVPEPSRAAQDFKDEYVDKVIENTVPKPEFVPQQSIGDVTGGDNSIVSPISQDNDISITGDSNTVSQDNSISQMMKDMRQSLRFAY